VNTVSPTTRERILDAAFGLTTADQADGLSMRRLADACGLNVATLYHHFPSKADLLRAVLEERGYPRRLGEEGPPAEVFRARSDEERVRRLLRWLWGEARAEESAWRLLLSEGMRGEPAAREEAERLLDLLEPVLADWLRRAAPDLDDARLVLAARLGRTLLLALAVEHLALGPDDRRSTHRIDDLVAAVVPVGSQRTR
jgi:AcrR family transcriptional regulator